MPLKTEKPKVKSVEEDLTRRIEKWDSVSGAPHAPGVANSTCLKGLARTVVLNETFVMPDHLAPLQLPLIRRGQDNHSTHKGSESRLQGASSECLCTDDARMCCRAPVVGFFLFYYRRRCANDQRASYGLAQTTSGR